MTLLEAIASLVVTISLSQSGRFYQIYLPSNLRRTLEAFCLQPPTQTLDNHIREILTIVKVLKCEKCPLPTPASSHCVAFYYKVFSGKWFWDKSYNASFWLARSWVLNPFLVLPLKSINQKVMLVTSCPTRIRSIAMPSMNNWYQPKCLLHSIFKNHPFT